MKKILFVTNQLVTGGIETALLETVKLINSPECEITVATLHSGGSLLKSFQSICNVIDLSPYYTKNCITKKDIIYNALHFQIFKLIKNLYSKFLEKIIFSRYTNLNRRIAKMPSLVEKYDIAIAYYNPYSAVDLYTINKVFANKKIVWVHADVSAFLTNIRTDQFSLIFKKYDNIICVSEAAQHAFISRHSQAELKTKVINNPINVEKILRMSNEMDGDVIQSKEITLCTVGRLAEEKGIDLAVSAHRILDNKGYKITWIVCGDGDRKDEIKKIVKNNNLNGKFILLGNQQNPYKYINISDIYVQPSKTESYCITLAEARALKKPIVTTNFPCAYEHITDGHNGFICDMTPEAVADAIEKLILSPELRKKFSENTKPIDSNYTELKALFE